MTKGHIKHVFPGGNTSTGFFSYYDYLAFPKRSKIFVMKGGPGVGKSTFMRKIGTELVERGYDVEYHHCSSDNGSLDGVYVPSLGIALLDGTAPHMVDPKHPGAVDEIVHLGDFWNEAGIRANQAQVVATFIENARLFRCAYVNIAAVKLYSDEIESYYGDSASLDYAGLNMAARKMIADIFGDAVRGGTQPQRHLFGSAISPQGPVNFLDTVVDKATRRFVIKGDMGTGKSTLVKKIFDEAVSRGYYVEAYHCALTHEHMEHLLIPELGVAVVTSIAPHVFEAAAGDTVIDTKAFVRELALERFKPDMERARELYWAALDRAVSFIARAKRNHDYLETFYVPHMDFDGISKRREQVLARILELADEQK